MGLTLVAILTAALLLPGLIAARAFYLAAQTREVEVPVPSLAGSDGIALVGFFSVIVHLNYIVGLKLVGRLPELIPAPVANPYLLFAAEAREIERARLLDHGGVDAGVFGSSESDLVRAIRESAQQNGSRAGDQLVSKNLGVQPTIKVRPGWPLRIVVHKDILLRPWQAATR